MTNIFSGHSYSMLQDSNSVQGRRRTLRGTVIVGVFFLLLVTTYASFSHIVSFIFQHSDDQYGFVGEVALITNYAVYLLGLTFAPAVGNFKRQFLIAAICYAANYAMYIAGLTHVGGLLTAIVGGVVGGYGASVVWISQGGYMVQLFRANNIKQEEEGKYMGILNGFVFLTVLVGAAITTFTLDFFSDRVYFIILTGLGIVAFLHCYFLLEPLDPPQNEQQPRVDLRTRLNQILSFFRFYPKMRYMLIPMILDGFMLGFVTTDLNRFLPQQLRKEVDVGILLMVHGAGAAMGGYFSGYLSDIMRISLQGLGLFVFMAVTFGLSLIRQSISVGTLTFPLFLGFMWGLALYFLQGWIFVCCTKIYKGQIQTYAVAKQMHTFSFILFQVYQVIFRNQNVVKQTIILLLVLSVISALISHFLLSKTEQASSQETHHKVNDHEESLISQTDDN